MRIQDYQMLSGALGGLQDRLLRDAIRREQKKQQDLENELRKAMFEFQRQQRGEDVAWREKRAGVEDSRFVDARDYGRQRDQIGDQRYGAERAHLLNKELMDDRYRRERDARGDQRQDELINLQRMEAALRMAQAGRKDDVTVRELGENGETFTYRMPRAQLRLGGQPGGAGRMTREELLEAVRSGRMTKERAKAIAREMGWE